MYPGDSRPTPLAYAQPLFLEEQPARAVLGRAGWVAYVAVGAVAAVTLFVCLLLYRAAPRVAAAPLLLLVPVVPVAVNLPVWASFHATAVTVVEPSAVQVRLTYAGFTLFRRTVRLSDVRGAEITTTWGERKVLQFFPGTVQFMTRGRSVRLRTGKFDEFVIGSERPDELLAAVNRAMEAGESSPVTASSSPSSSHIA